MHIDQFTFTVLSHFRGMQLWQIQKKKLRYIIDLRTEIICINLGLNALIHFIEKELNLLPHCL